MARMTFAVTGSERTVINGISTVVGINTSFSGDFASEYEGRRKVIDWFGLDSDPRVIEWKIQRTE